MISLLLMLISHSHQFIYTKTVKTAGTSVESFFEPFCIPPGKWKPAHHRDELVSNAGIVGYRGPNPAGRKWYNHMPAHEIKTCIGNDIWSRYFKFCVVRNPFDMLISWFYFRVHRGLVKVSGEEGDVQSFRACISDDIPVLGREQYSIEGKLCVDFFIRFEELQKDIKTVCRKLSLPCDERPVPKLKTGLRNSDIQLSDFYTPSLASRVRDAYAFEVENFGYDL